MKKRIFFILLISILSQAIVGQTILSDQVIKEFVGREDMRGASFGIEIRSIDNKDTLVSYNPDLLITPASVMKLVTTGTALGVLGEDFKFKTHIEHDGTFVNGVIKGNLYIRGEGDPTLGSKKFAVTRGQYPKTIIKKLKELGVKKIEGSVIADADYYVGPAIGSQWIMEDLGNYYATGAYALNVLDNTYNLKLRSKKTNTKAEILATDPSIPFLHFNNELVVTNKRYRDSVYVLGAPFDAERYLHGHLPANVPLYIIKGDIPDPPFFAAWMLKEELVKSGIEVSKSASSTRIMRKNNEPCTKDRTLLASFDSPPLKDIVNVINHQSFNLFAEALINRLGAEVESDVPGSQNMAALGVEKIKEYLTSKGLDCRGLVQFDGSGLSPVNKVSVDFLVNLLNFYYNEPKLKDSFYRSLPKAGMEGTVRYVLDQTPYQGALRLKSGSMNRVRGYGGYWNHNKKTYSIVLLVNNYSYSPRQIYRELESFLLELLSSLSEAK